MSSCAVWTPADWLSTRRAPAPSCDSLQLVQLMDDLGRGPVQASVLVEGLGTACSEVFSPSLSRALERWSGLEASSLSEIPPVRMCEGLDGVTPLREDRPEQMNEVFESCAIAEDGLFDATGFQSASGPFAGLVASRLYAALSAGGVPGTRAVELARLVAGNPSRVLRGVYGDHAAKIWRVQLMEAVAPRMETPACTPTVVAGGQWIRWQDREWVPLSDGHPVGLVAKGPGPPYLESGAELGAWQSSREACHGKGKSVLVAMDPGVNMELARPLLWTLDGLDGYHPELLVRQPEDSPLTESSPLGRFVLRVVDVQAFERESADSLFLLPETSILVSGDIDAEGPHVRGPDWLPGIHLEVLPEGMRLRLHGELRQESGEADPEQILAELSPHADQIRAEGLVLGLHDGVEVRRLVGWLEQLQDWTDLILLDARSPDPWTVVD